MDALSRILRERGAIISGSDAQVGAGHRRENITADIDAVVINGAIADDNVELLRARELGITIIGREELLADIESGYKNRIAVAGCHGKSTTVAMIGAVLRAAGFNPTVHCGAKMNSEVPPNALILGGTDYFVTEACEFKRSFLKLNPTVAVITNIDFDHADCYRDIYDVRETFRQFADKCPTVIQHDNDQTAEVVIQNIKLRVAGAHNRENAILAVKVGLHFGVSVGVIRSALENFTGIERRFQNLGKVGECDVIADFAHHPTEIHACIDTATEIYGAGKFLIVFQPHTYTRTIALFDDFLRVLKRADCVVYKTYSAREKEIKGGTGRDLAHSARLPYFKTAEALKKFLMKKSKKYRAIVLTGAGDVCYIPL